MKGNMYTLLSPAQSSCGRFEIQHFELTQQHVKQERFAAIMSRRAGEVMGLEAGKYVRLIDVHNMDVVMSDTAMECYTNAGFCRRANGHVLVAGIGIGYIINEIQNRENIKSITVIEKYQSIIDMVAPQLQFN